MARNSIRAEVDPLTAMRQVADEYRERLTGPAVVPLRRWEPLTLGPTWKTEDGHWVLPERTLGWWALGWAGVSLQLTPGEPWRYTDEQARFLLWWYALDEAGEFLFRDGVLQRMKGWGKDPFGATLCAIEMLGPCRFDGWDEDGDPIPTDSPRAWVQTAAVAQAQTKNTTRWFPTMFTTAARQLYGLQILKSTVYGLGDQRMIEAVTSSPETLEGAPATFVLLNETHHWKSMNSGHEMAAVIERNATKSPDGAARTLRITNAYEPGEDSVGERDREAAEATAGGDHVDVGILYDSLEAPPDAPLTAEDAPDVVRSIRGDSHWISETRVVKSILDRRNPPSRSRRYWYNQIWAAEDSWVARPQWDGVRKLREVPGGAIVTLGFDGSTSDDWSALIACEVETDHVFPVGIWDPAKFGGEAPREVIDGTVRRAFELYDVVGFYSDLHPWESYVDTWQTDLAENLLVKASNTHRIAFDMRSRSKDFTRAAESFHAAVIDGVLTHDGDPTLAQHVYNARRRPNQHGVTFGKEHRESSRKVDALAAAVLARRARADYLALPETRRRRKRSGKASFL